MNTSQQIAQHLRDVHLGGNWTSVNLKETLKDVNWQQAITRVHNFNTIATLVFHINYYVGVIMKVLQGNPLEGKDELSFNHLPINSQQDWENLLNKVWSDAETFAAMIEQMPDSKLHEVFFNEKYGTYYRNLHGFIEHTHYHLGQIVLIKKLLQNESYGIH